MQESHLSLLRTYFKAAGAFTAWLTDWRPECQKGEYTRNHASKLPTTTSPTFSGCRNFLSTSGSSGLACALTPVCGEGIHQTPCSLHALGELPPCSVTAMGLKCGDSAPQGPQGNGALLELSRLGPARLLSTPLRVPRVAPMESSPALDVLFRTQQPQE